MHDVLSSNLNVMIIAILIFSRTYWYIPVCTHVAASKPCSAAKLGFREIQVDVRTSDVMAGAGGGAGPAPDVRHQPEGTVC